MVRDLTTRPSEPMPRTDSLPALSERGRGLADLKGHDPMDRRLEVEKKERYAQALREQMALNAANRSGTPERELHSTPHWGTAGGGGTGLPVSSPHWGANGGTSLPPPPPADSPPGSGARRSRGSTPLMGAHDSAAHTADRVAEVQDVMRQRIHMLQDEQQRQWQSVQALLQQQMHSVREAADKAVQQQLEAAREGHDAELRRALGEVDAVRRENAASAQRGLAQADELAALRQQVGRLTAQGGDHRAELDTHTAEIERLKAAHDECARFRTEVWREHRSLSDIVAQLRSELGDAVRQVQDSARQQQKQAGDLERLHAAQQECAHARADLAREVRASSEAVAQLRGDAQELARKFADLPVQLKKLRDDVPRLAAKAARDYAEQHLRVPEPTPTPTPPPAYPLFPAEVSEEAYALFRNAEGELYELPELQNVVGRSPACNVCIPGSQAISNRHAELDVDREGKFSIKDLGSRNGTFLNDRRVPLDAGFVIKSGDSIRLGVDGPTYVFEFGPAYYARWPQDPERVRSGRPLGHPTLAHGRPNR